MIEQGMKTRVLLAGALALTLLVGFAGGWLTHEPHVRVVVPDVQGLSSERAADLLHRAGLRVSFTPVSATTLPHRLLVAQQSPPAGTAVAPDATVQLRIRVGPVIPSPIG
jgi:hypothetical protein